MMYSQNGQLNKHIYCYIDSTFTHDMPQQYNYAVWFGLVSYPGRMWGCTVMFEDGAIYRNIPPHAISFCKNNQTSWRQQDAQLWDCYGYDFTVVDYTYLSGLSCTVMIGDYKIDGTYLFTVSPMNDGFSTYPEQSKEFMFIKLNNDRLTIQPTNKVLFNDRSFVDNGQQLTKCLKLQTQIYSCERSQS